MLTSDDVRHSGVVIDALRQGIELQRFLSLSDCFGISLHGGQINEVPVASNCILRVNLDRPHIFPLSTSPVPILRIHDIRQKRYPERSEEHTSELQSRVESRMPSSA